MPTALFRSWTDIRRVFFDWFCFLKAPKGREPIESSLLKTHPKKHFELPLHAFHQNDNGRVNTLLGYTITVLLKIMECKFEMF